MYDKDDSRDKQTIEFLQTLKETPPRDPDQAAQARKAFLAQAQKISNQPVSIPILERLRSVFRPRKLQLRFSTLTIGLILSVFLLTISSSAYAARQSRPDQLFYTFKLWLENSRLSLTSQPDEKIDLHLVYAEERLKELTLEGSTYSDGGIERAMDNLSGHLDALRGLFGEDQEQNGRRDRLNVILDQYEQLEEHDREQDTDLEEHEDEPHDPEQLADDKDEDTEDQSETEEQEEISEDDSNKGKRRKESENNQQTDDSGEAPEDDEDHEEENEPTETPDDDSEDGDDKEDPTKTPEPDDDD